MKTENRKIESMSILLRADPENNILGRNLDSHRLDFSIESLEEVDDYIAKLKNKDLSEEERKKIILRCGTYLGEVIRKLDARRFNWISYETACEMDPTISRFERSLLTHILLYDKKKKNFYFPLNRIYKFLDTGRENSTISFARFVVRK